MSLTSLEMLGMRHSSCRNQNVPPSHRVAAGAFGHDFDGSMMSAFGGKAYIAITPHLSAFDPKRITLCRMANIGPPMSPDKIAGAEPPKCFDARQRAFLALRYERCIALYLEEA